MDLHWSECQQAEDRTSHRPLRPLRGAYLPSPWAGSVKKLQLYHSTSLFPVVEAVVETQPLIQTHHRVTIPPLEGTKQPITVVFVPLSVIPVGTEVLQEGTRPLSLNPVIKIKRLSVVLLRGGRTTGYDDDDSYGYEENQKTISEMTADLKNALSQMRLTTGPTGEGEGEGYDSRGGSSSAVGSQGVGQGRNESKQETTQNFVGNLGEGTAGNGQPAEGGNGNGNALDPKDYESLMHLGEGAGGAVEKVRDRRTGKVMAMKVSCRCRSSPSITEKVEILTRIPSGHDRSSRLPPTPRSINRSSGNSNSSTNVNPLTSSNTTVPSSPTPTPVSESSWNSARPVRLIPS